MKYLKQVMESLYLDKDIKKFIKDNKLTENDIINNLSALTIQMNNNKVVESNPEKCLLDPYGMVSKISYINGKVNLTYNQVKNTDNKLERLFFPSKEEVLSQELHVNENRAEIIKEITSIKRNFKPNNYFKGVYLHGKFGTGKTFIMQKLAISLCEKGANVIIAYYPDLVRTIKSSITSRETEVIINKLKYADVLILDDIGAETNTNFIRDEVIGPILQFRMESKLPMCMTSNLSLDELKIHFEDTASGVNTINSQRIISRIRFLMNEVCLDDIDYRNFN